MISGEEFLKWKYPNGSTSTLVAGGVPAAKTVKKMVGDGVMLVGDAAHFVNPMTGGGIASGMKGGQIAGRVA